MTGGEQDPPAGGSSSPPARGRVPLPLLIAVWVLLALVAVAGLVTVTVGWGHEAWASTEVEGNIKTIQAIVLGLGFLGVVAGAVVTYRRQQTMQDQLDHDRKRLDHERRNDQDRLDEDRRKYQLELDKFAQEQAKYAQEQVRETQRRQQERYAQGAQMLADQSPAVRIAGLNVIAALGREVAPQDELRQTCVNLVCAYLRASSPAAPQHPTQDRVQETAGRDDIYRVVAAEACRLLPTLLEEVPAPDDTTTTPPGLDLDLRQVNLIDLDISGRHLGTVICSGATFSGEAARFDGATFSGIAMFDGAAFSGIAGFGRATFSVAWFEQAAFSVALFDGAAFSGIAGFEQATFSRAALFEQATFSGIAMFDGAAFSGEARFDGATFSGEARFGDETFTRAARFGGARFEKYKGPNELGAGDVGRTIFDGAVFGPEPDDRR